MRFVKIEAADKKFRKHNRVVVNVGTKNKPEYYLGTVDSVRGGKVYIELDDGDEVMFSENTSKAVKTNIEKKRRSEIPPNKVEDYIYKSPKKKSAQKSPNKQPTLEELFQDTKDKGKNEQFHFLSRLWSKLNKDKFNGMLSLPNEIRFMKNVKKFRSHGKWNKETRTISITPRIFNGNYEQAKKLMLHEMCHQAVTDIENTVENVKQGHGPLWSKWMKHVGLNPERYVPKEEHENLMTKEEKERIEKIKDKERDLKKKVDVSKGNSIKIVNPETKEIALARIIVQMAGGQFLVMSEDGSTWQAPPSKMFEVTEKERERAEENIPEFKLRDVRMKYINQLEKKRARRRMKNKN